jgi:hypothetical protein
MVVQRVSKSDDEDSPDSLGGGSQFLQHGIVLRWTLRRCIEIGEVSGKFQIRREIKTPGG